MRQEGRRLGSLPTDAMHGTFRCVRLSSAKVERSSRRSTTAEGAAFCRALGALEPPPLRNPDHLAHHFVTRTAWRLGLLPLVRRLARRDVEQRLPGALLLHHARTRVFDDLVMAAVREGASQVVLLGAGGDSRAYRIPALGKVLTFEVDHPETGSWKQARVKRMLGGLPEHVRYVPIDFGTDALVTALERAGFDRERRTFFLWEGVTMYLRPDAVEAVLSLVAQSSEGSGIGFDYLYAEPSPIPIAFTVRASMRSSRHHAASPSSSGSRQSATTSLPSSKRVASWLPAAGTITTCVPRTQAMAASCPS